MRLLVLGAGMMGRAAAFDMAQQPDVDEVALADIDIERANAAAAAMGSEKVVPTWVDATQLDEVTRAMRDTDAVLGAVSYRHNVNLANCAIRAGTHFCDLGGNNTIVDAELELDEAAKKRGVSVIPDCGLAPGMASLLAKRATEKLDTTRSIRLRVGGLPVDPQPPLDYMIVFSVQGLINEYIEPCIVVRGGKITQAQPMTDVEQIEFPPPFGALEAFHTSGGASTLPRSLLGRVSELDYKTIRYPGHCAKMKAILDLGLASEERLGADCRQAVPRDVLEACLYRSLPRQGDDVVLLRVTASGTKDGREARVKYEMIDHCDKATGLSAMMRGTAFPASIVALMMARGETVPGAVPQELSIDSGKFMAEIQARGMPLKEDLEPA